MKPTLLTMVTAPLLLLTSSAETAPRFPIEFEVNYCYYGISYCVNDTWTLHSDGTIEALGLGVCDGGWRYLRNYGPRGGLLVDIDVCLAAYRFVGERSSDTCFAGQWQYNGDLFGVWAGCVP